MSTVRRMIVNAAACLAMTAAVAHGEGTSSDEAAVRAVSDGFNQAMDHGDAKAAGAAFTDDGTLTTPTGETVRGRAAIEKLVADFHAGPMKDVTHKMVLGGFHFVRPDVVVADGDVQASGPSMPTIAAKLTEIAVKKDGKWRLTDVRAYTFLTRHAE
jgi:uncharacterized protein (TIGR02246 family)